MSLQSHILQGEANAPGSTGDFTWILSALSLAAKAIAYKVRLARIEDVLGDIGADNVHGESQQKLDVIANPTSSARSGMSRTSESARCRCSCASAPSALQVMTRWCVRERIRSARRLAATLSGLFPERANDTSSVGTSSARWWRGFETRSVVAMLSTRRPVARATVGATTPPANAEVPAPVRTICRSSSASSGARKSSRSARR